MLNWDNGAILLASTFIFAASLSGKVCGYLEKIGLKIDKKTKRATLGLLFSSLLLLTGYFYVAYLLLLRWPS